MNKRICVCIPSLTGGGAEKQCINLLNVLQKDDSLEIHLIYCKGGVNFENLNDKNLRLWNLPIINFNNPIHILRFYGLVKRIDPDVLFSWILFMDIYSSLYKIINPKVKWIMAERNSNYPNTLKYILRNYFGTRADQIVANSKEGLKYWQFKGVPSKKLKMIPNMLVLNKSAGAQELPGSPIITYAGRFESQKNILNVTKAFCKITDQLNEAKCYIIGEGSLKLEILDIIRRHNAEKKVFVLPYQKDIESYFIASTVFVNISLREGMPNTVLENVVFDNLVVLSKIPEHTALLGDNYPLFVDEADNIGEISSTILKALELAECKNLLGFAKEYISNLTPEVIAKKYSELIKN